MTSERVIRNTVNYYQSSYKLEPWGQSSQLPFILRNSKPANSVINDKKKNKLSLHSSAQKQKKSQNLSPIFRDASVYSFSYAKKNKNPKLDENIYRPKSIKNMQLLEENIKKKLKKRLSRKQKYNTKNIANINSNFPEIAPSRFSTQSIRANIKVEKALQIQRKIYKLMSKQKY